MRQPIEVAVIGASGYTGLELIKMLIAHPLFSISYIATSEGGGDIQSLHPSLRKVYAAPVEKADAAHVAQKAQLAFLALPHKAAMGFAKELVKLGVKVVDLSADYRLELETYERHYCSHEDKENLLHAVYGLPEIYREQIRHAHLIANPGCYPTATILGLLPFAKLIDPRFPVIVDAKSGVSGAGKKCVHNTHYVTINENLFAYSPLVHRHEPEIKEKLEKASGQTLDVKFVPHLLPLTRGVLVSSYVQLTESVDPIGMLKAFYEKEPFVRVREEPVDIKSVAGTNFCDIFAKQSGSLLYLSSTIDNLLKGASSAAVVNANLMCGLPEEMGIPTIAYVP